MLQYQRVPPHHSSGCPPVRSSRRELWRALTLSLEDTAQRRKDPLRADRVRSRDSRPRQNRRVADTASRRSTSQRRRTGTGKGPRAQFLPGNKMIARTSTPPGVTRLPPITHGQAWIAAGHDWGVLPYRMARAHRDGAKPAALLGVKSSRRENCGAADHPARERIYLDLWEDCLESDRGQPSKSGDNQEGIETAARQAAVSNQAEDSIEDGQGTTQPRRAR